jgi:hypothetical protein
MALDYKFTYEIEMELLGGFGAFSSKTISNFDGGFKSAKILSSKTNSS